MYIITATFDPDAAFARTSEVLDLGDAPERLAERLGIARDLEIVKRGVASSSFKRLVNDIAQIRQFIEINQQIEDVKNDKSALRFLGSGFKERQIAKLEEQAGKFGSLLDAPEWFYQQPRVRLLSAIRDYALDCSQQGDAAWVEVDKEKLAFPSPACSRRPTRTSPRPWRNNWRSRSRKSTRASCSRNSRGIGQSRSISTRAWRPTTRPRRCTDLRSAVVAAAYDRRCSFQGSRRAMCDGPAHGVRRLEHIK